MVIACACAIPNASASARVRAADDGSSPVAVLVDGLSTSNDTGSPSYEATIFSPSAGSPAASAVVFRNAKTQDIQAMSSATGAVFGVAHSSGTNTAAPATAQQPRSFYAAFAKVGTSYGPAGPGGVLVRRANGNVDTLAVVPNAQNGTTIPGHSSLGSVALDPQEQQLFVVNLHDRFVYQVDTWDSAAVPRALPASPGLLTPETCNGHPSDLQPAALHVRGTRLLLGTICTAESTGVDQDVSAAVWAFDLVTNTWAVKPVFETTFGPPAGLFRVARHWAPNGPVALPAPRQLLLSHIDIAESGTLLLGFRNRGADTTTLPTAGDEGLVLRATPAGERWADPFLDRGAMDTAVVTRGLLGALAATPGSVWGLPGDELAATARSLDPNGANGLVWLDRANPQPAQTETLSATSANALPGALGDLTLLAAWRSVTITVFSDANADGVQQAAEVPLDGVRLSVSVAGDANISATVTSGVLDGQRGQVRLYLSPFERYQLTVDATTFAAEGVTPGGRRSSPAGELAFGTRSEQATAPALGITTLAGAPSATVEPQVLAATAMPTTGNRPGRLLVAAIAFVVLGTLFVLLTKIGHPAKRRQLRR
jgi:hypothetical protein